MWPTTRKVVISRPWQMTDCRQHRSKQLSAYQRRYRCRNVTLRIFWAQPMLRIAGNLGSLTPRPMLCAFVKPNSLGVLA